MKDAVSFLVLGIVLIIATISLSAIVINNSAAGAATTGTLDTKKQFDTKMAEISTDVTGMLYYEAKFSRSTHEAVAVESVYKYAAIYLVAKGRIHNLFEYMDENEAELTARNVDLEFVRTSFEDWEFAVEDILIAQKNHIETIAKDALNPKTRATATSYLTLIDELNIEVELPSPSTIYSSPFVRHKIERIAFSE